MRYLIFEINDQLLEIDSITGGMKYFSYSGKALNKFYFDGCSGVTIFTKDEKKDLSLREFIHLYDNSFYHSNEELHFKKWCPKYRIKLSNGDYLNYLHKLLYFKT